MSNKIGLMKKTLYTSQFLTAEIDENEAIAYIYTHSKIGILNNLEYQAEVQTMLSAFNITSRIGAILIDSHESTFPISPEIQQWIAEQYGRTFIPRGAKKCAMVLPADFISNISYDQTADEARKMGFTAQIDIQNFTSVEIAEKWLHS